MYDAKLKNNFEDCCQPAFVQKFWESKFALKTVFFFSEVVNDISVPVEEANQRSWPNSEQTTCMGARFVTRVTRETGLTCLDLENEPLESW